MTPELMGALAGALLGVVSFFVIRVLVDKMETGEAKVDRKPDEKRNTAEMLRSLAWLEIPFFAAVGYFIGPMFL